MISIKTLASGSKGNAYLLSDGQSSILLECGIKYRDIQIATGFKASEITGCLVTHEHKDHTKGLKDVVKNGIDVHASKGTIEAEGIDHHRLNVVEARKQFKIGSWTILPFEVEHDAAEPLGFLIVNGNEKVLFATDTYYVRYKFKGLTHIMIECNYSLEILDENIEAGYTPLFLKRRLLKSHFSLENVIEFLKVNDLSKLKEVHLLHLSDSNSNEVEFNRKVQEVTGVPVYIA